MRAVVPLLLSLLPAATVAFVPPALPRGAAPSTARALAGDPDIDIEHGQFCAEHFGECSLEDMEQIRNALHQERIAHAFADPPALDPAADVAHGILERDLSLQMGLLQDRMATEGMRRDSLAAYGMDPRSSTVSWPVLDGGLDEESSEALVICMVIAALALLPQFI